MALISKIFGNPNEKYLKKIKPIVDKINSLEGSFEKVSDEKLKEKTFEFKERLKKGETLDDILPEAFALVREAAKRTLKQRHFNVQLIGGIVLHQGKIAEMKTGEGKTLAATLPLYLNALEGKGCHLVTVNDYLARRDTVWMGQIYHFLGLSVGCLNHEQSFLYDPEYKKPPEEKEKMRDELGGFYVVEDFLRPCERKEAYLADITYGTNNEFGFDYLRDNMVYDLKEMVQRDLYYAIIDEVDSILIDEARTPLIISAPDTESSRWYQEFAKIIPQLNPDTDYQVDKKMRVVTLTEKGIERVEKILGMGNIYQEKGIRYLHHLEQALRAHTLFKRDVDYIVKNGEVIIIDEFTGRLMPGRRWSGGLHQAIEAKEGVEVKPESITLASITFQNYFRLYKKLAGMTGTAMTSAEEFDKVYNLEVICVPTNKPMIRLDLPDQIYKTEKAKFKALIKEIKQRHQKGQPILVGTRSVEKNEYLGKLLEIEGIPHQILNAKHHEKEAQIIAQAGKLGAVTVATNMAGRGVDIILGGNPPDPEEAKKVVELGGLHVIGTERHEARRIDNQLRGRAGRQGDPGSSQFFISLEDDLIKIFGGEKIKSLMEVLKIPEDQPIQSHLVSRAIEEAQSRIEGMNFDLRKHLLEYDNVMNVHRETFYRKRREILERAEKSNLSPLILEIIKKNGFKEKEYYQKEREIGAETMRKLEKYLFLRILDALWIEHLENMEYLKDAVRLRAYGQRDPLVEYKHEAHKMFKNLLSQVEYMVAHNLMNIKKVEPQNSETSFSKPSHSQKVHRNDPCPCGSGKKYKKCCFPKYG
jgi:preprotein translocase subunit SecA